MKKVVSLLLVLVLALGMSTVAFAATNRIDGQLLNLPNATGTVFGKTAWVDGGSVHPADVLEVALPANISGSPLFTYDGGRAVGASTSGVSKAEMSKVKVMTRVAKGSKLIDVNVKYNSAKNAYIKIEFNEPWVSNDTDGIDFDFTVYLAIGNERFEELGAQITGTLYNRAGAEIDADTDYVNLAGGMISECTEYNKGLEYYLGEGISAFGKAFKGKNYYAYVDKDASDAQSEVMDKYGIDDIYNVYQSGLAAVVNYVVLDDADPDAYVYDGNLKYLGQAKEHLPLASTYYLAAKKLDVDEEEPEEEDGEDAPELPSVTGGDSEAGFGVNDNPSTGA